MKQIFSFPRKVVLLKGRANYLCQERLSRSMTDGRFTQRQFITQLHTIKEWENTTHAGDISECDTVPEDSGIWPYVTSTTDNCLNQDCEFYKTCYVVKARVDAMTADILVVNHHLFFADVALQEEGFGELLPGTEVVIFDEAHQLPDIAAQFFSKTLSGRQLTELTRDAEAESLKEAKDMPAIIEEGITLQKAVHDMRLALGQDFRRAPWPFVLSPILQKSIEAVKRSLQSLECILKEASIRSKGLENCWRRAIHFVERFNIMTGEPPPNTIHWFETFLQSFTLQLTPMMVAEHFKECLKIRKSTWIFTSATLTVNNSFQLFVDALGLDKALKLQLKSPFDYKKQALLYAPRGLPDPRASHYTQSMAEVIIPVLEITQGKTFILFTSYKALEYMADILNNRIPYPLLLQGSMPKRQLIDEFKRLGNAVLLGTSSFWYGVDVRGEALSCVIIDKLPFAAPEDPILQARIQMCKKQGIDPFHSFQLPNAVLILKQGVGRLIRDSQDRGILMICDPRLVAARYGEVFLKSLPNMSRTRELINVQNFIQNDQDTRH